MNRKTIKVNSSASTRVLLASFDDNWNRTLADSGAVIYTATESDAVVNLLLQGDITQTLIFKAGARIIVMDEGFHFPPHLREVPYSNS